MNNPPIKMTMQENSFAVGKEVLVYDFITDTETLNTYALCWVTSSNNWVTVPIYCVAPLNQKQPLNE
jgi:hypothetical protein